MAAVRVPCRCVSPAVPDVAYVLDATPTTSADVDVAA